MVRTVDMNQEYKDIVKDYYGHEAIKKIKASSDQNTDIEEVRENKHTSLSRDS